MTNLPLQVPPGIVKVTSPNGASGRYIGCDKVRFVGNGVTIFPEKWMGWVKYISDQLLGVARGMVSWTNAFGNINVAVGTNLKLYAVLGDDTLTDITPIRASSTIDTNPFAVTDGSTLVTVTDTLHGADTDNFVTYSGALEVGGLNLNGIYQLTKVDNNTYTFTAASAASVDPLTKILLHFNGTDASTTITDQNTGGAAHTWTPVGNAQIDTAQSKFDGASLLLDGAGDYVTTPDSADFTLGSAAFTADFWFNCNVAGGTLLYLCGQSDSTPTAASTSIRIERTTGNVIKAHAFVGSTDNAVTGTTQFTNAVHTGWHHCAFVRTGNILRLFIDGVQEGGDVACTGTVNDSASVFAVGTCGAVTTTSWNGWIDEFRLSVGVARWTAGFTPPTSAYPSRSPGGGAAVVAAYQIPTGSSGTVYGLGFGAGPFGLGTFGTPRAQGIPLELRWWSVVKYGSDLMASPSLGGLYLYDDTSDATAQVVSGAPTAIRAMFVTGERFVFAMVGMTVSWPDIDDITDWTPSLINTANTRTLQSGGKLINGCPLTDGTNALWSDTSLYVFTKTTDDFIYSDRLAGNNCGLIGPLAFVCVSGVAFWLSGQNAYQYVTGVQLIQNFQDIQEYVFSRLDPAMAAKVWAEYDQANNQVRWHYCTVGATEPDEYFDVDLTNWLWTVGTNPESSTTGCVHRPAEASSLFASSDGYLFNANVGLNADGNPLDWFLDFPLFTLTRGEQNVDIFDIFQDVQRQVGDLTYEIFTKEYSDLVANLDDLTVTMAPGAGRAEARVSGRYWGMRISQTGILNGDCRLQIPKLNVQDAGERP